MAVKPVKPLILQDSILTIGTDDYAAAIASAVLTPASSIVTFKGLKADSVHSFPVRATWTADLEYAQDWETTDSFSRYLFDHEGELIENVVLEPASGVGTRWTFDLYITPGAVGGAVDAVGTATVSLGITGRPVPTAIV